MDAIWEGIKIGLILCCLIGPIFFAIIQASVEEGARAGTMVGFGIWISDFLFIAAVYLGLAYISQVASSEKFALYLGIGGSITLSIFGIGAIVTAPKVGDRPQWASYTPKKSSYLSHWLKGFLINTINPFTFFFWIGVASTVVVDGELNDREALLFFSGVLGTIIITDMAKVLLAKRIRRSLRPIHLLWLRRISGGALIVFGLVLLVRVLFY
jgi:threonine/homoserine/homoserine lactone efflux protein